MILCHGICMHHHDDMPVYALARAYSCTDITSIFMHIKIIFYLHFLHMFCIFLHILCIFIAYFMPRWYLTHISFISCAYSLHIFCIFIHILHICCTFAYLMPPSHNAGLNVSFSFNATYWTSRSLLMSWCTTMCIHLPDQCTWYAQILEFNLKKMCKNMQEYARICIGAYLAYLAYVCTHTLLMMSGLWTGIMMGQVCRRVILRDRPSSSGFIIGDGRRRGRDANCTQFFIAGHRGISLRASESQGPSLRLSLG